MCECDYFRCGGTVLYCIASFDFLWDLKNPESVGGSIANAMEYDVVLVDDIDFRVREDCSATDVAKESHREEAGITQLFE